MSQANFHRDSTSSGAEGASLPPQPTPPPPPLRATLPPVRSSSFGPPKPATGVGSAAGVRWRGELDEIAPPPADLADRRGGLATSGARRPQESSASGDPVTRTAPPWLISTVVHLILLLALALITSPAGESLGRVLLTIGQSDGQVPTELQEFTFETSDTILKESEFAEDAVVDLHVPDIFDSQQDSQTTELAQVELGIGTELVDIRPMFNGRSGAMKQALLAIYGGTKQTQDAVAMGLLWLKRNQMKDGSWSLRGPFDGGGIAENKAAATAMALLAFMGDGNTHLDGEYRDEVDRGIRYLIKLQDRSGNFDKDSRHHQRAYSQAQATIAICELYGMTQDSWLRPRAQLAVDFAVAAQSPQGGWRYQPRTDSDTSVTGWYVMALKSAESAQLDVDSNVFYQVGRYLDTAQVADGAGYAYVPNGRLSASMTAEGLLCRQYLGWDRSIEPMVVGIETLVETQPFNIRDHNVYYWYYATQAMHHYGGEPWNTWNEAMRTQLPAAQIRSGREQGSWPPNSDAYGESFGRLYTTCLSIYCLEVYYRHMPLYAHTMQ